MVEAILQKLLFDEEITPREVEQLKPKKWKKGKHILFGKFQPYFSKKYLKSHRNPRKIHKKLKEEYSTLCEEMAIA
jgi:hypothetical protein